MKSGTSHFKNRCFRLRPPADTKNYENSSCTGLESERFEQAFELFVDVLLLQRVVIGCYVEILPGYDVLFRVDYEDIDVGPVLI